MRTSAGVSLGCRLATLWLYLLLPQRSKSDGDRVVPRPPESICARTSWSAIFVSDSSCLEFNSCLDDRTECSCFPEMKPIRSTSSEMYLQCDEDLQCKYEHSTMDSAPNTMVSEPSVHAPFKDAWKKTAFAKERLKTQMLRRRLREKEREIHKLREELQATSYSWSANVCGHKEWLLYPPGEEENLRDSLGNLPFDVTSPELNNRAKYPNAWKAQQPIRVVQEPGEIIFVPSGWHHQVRNLEDTISINHNWANAFSLKYMWNHLKSELQLVKLEIADCREMEGWEQQCQLILKVSAGMDYKEFFQFLCLVAFPRLQELEKLSSVMFKENCPPESDTANSPLFPDLQHHVLKAFSDSTLTFFQSELVKGMKCQTHADGSPVLSLIGLHSSLIAKDNLEAVVTRCCKCSDSTIDMQAPAQPPLYKLHQLLPLRLQHLLKQKLNTGVALLHKTCFIFRAFELHTIWQTMQEMLSNADFTAVFPS